MAENMSSALITLARPTYELYEVDFYDDVITTIVTADPATITAWVAETRRRILHGTRKTLVGFKVERVFYQDLQLDVITVLQLCVGLVVPLLHLPLHRIPLSLMGLMDEVRCCFVGVGLGEDLQDLQRYHGFGGHANYVDLRVLFSRRLEIPFMENIGLSQLVDVVLDKVYERMGWVDDGQWDAPWIDIGLVMYDALDPYLSYEVGRTLNGWWP